MFKTKQRSRERERQTDRHTDRCVHVHVTLIIIKYTQIEVEIMWSILGNIVNCSIWNINILCSQPDSLFEFLPY